MRFPWTTIVRTPSSRSIIITFDILWVCWFVFLEKDATVNKETIYEHG
jgi:hypothetical protein